MCTVISGDCGCGGSSSSGVTAEGFVATVVVAGAIAALGAVFQVIWVLWLVALCLGWICAFRWSRHAAAIACTLLAAGVLWLVRTVWRRWRRTRPVQTVALPRPYKATVYVTRPDGRRAVLGTAPVPGVWASQADVEREIVARWEATHGRCKVGQIGCHAQPLA